VEVVPPGETVNTKPRAGETKPDPLSTDPKKSDQPTRVPNPEKDARTVTVFGCSPKVKEPEVRARWPSAESVLFFFGPRNNRPTGTLCVVFKTVAAAEAAVKEGTVELAGEKLRVAKHETPEERAKRIEKNQRKVHMSSLPSGVTEADVLKAFPGAESATLHKNKQGEANGWATVVLRTVEAAAAAAGVEVEVKGAKVTPFADGKRPPETPEERAKRMEKNQRKVHMSSLPSGVTEADVLKAFPGAEAASLHKNKQGEANGGATVILRTAEAAAAAAGVEVEVKGVKVTPFADGQRPPATESSKKRKAAELSPTAQPSTATAEPGEASKPAKKKLKKAASN